MVPLSTWCLWYSQDDSVFRPTFLGLCIFSTGSPRKHHTARCHTSDLTTFSCMASEGEGEVGVLGTLQEYSVSNKYLKI